MARGSARAADALRTSNGGLLALAVVVGAGAGLGAVVFRWLIKTFTEICPGYADYAGRGHVANPHVPALGIYFVLLTPVLAGSCTDRWSTSSPGRRAGTACPR